MNMISLSYGEGIYDPQRLVIPFFVDAKVRILSRVSEFMDHSFSTYAKFSTKLTFLTPFKRTHKYLRIMDKKF